jgi:hypothetical protein
MTNIYTRNISLTLKPKNKMKKLLLIGVVLVMTACSSTNFVAHKVSETPKITRQALIYEDHVIIVTRTRLTLDEYNKIIAVSITNREERN